MFFDQKFVIYHDSGKTEIVEDLITYIRAVGYPRFHASMKFNVGEYKKCRDLYGTPAWYDAYSRGRSNYCDNHTGFFLCTEKGLMISPDLLVGEYERMYNGKSMRERHRERMWSLQGKTSHTTSRYKHPTTHQARRKAAGVVSSEGEPEFRGRRSTSNLHTHWDDINVRRSCSWKNCTKRKQQYKGS